MELELKKVTCNCMDMCLGEVQNAEQTLEIRLPDDYPDAGRILSAWSQPVVRSKEWHSQQIAVSCGLMVWVLYAPEDDSVCRCLEGWIPYQLRWDIPQTGTDGAIRLELQPRFVDARTTSPRKIMVRSGLAVLAQAYVERETSIWEPGSAVEAVELLQQVFPVQLMKEAGEKQFLLTEELTLPASAPVPEELVCYTLRPEVTDRKVIANKAVFRGNGNLHLLYRAESGQLHTWDFPLAFSQYGELDRTYGSDAQVDIALCVSALELEKDEDGVLHLKCGLVGQYVVQEQQMQTVVTDAYLPGKQLNIQEEELHLPVILDSRQESLSGQQEIPGNVSVVVDAQFLTDYPVMRQSDGATELRFQHSAQLLCYGEGGLLQTQNAHWESVVSLKTVLQSRILTIPKPAEQPQILTGADTIQIQWDQSYQLITLGDSSIPMVTGVEEGETVSSPGEQPSVILLRPEGESLWDIAKKTGSTREAIRKANGFQEEPTPGQMLLIPISAEKV